MLRPAALLLVLAVAVAAPGEARLRRVQRDTLLKVTAPSVVAVANAHPFVNFKVYFGATNTGVPADPKTFRAHLGRRDVTRLFEDFVDNGGAGRRARIEPPIVRVGPHTVNHLRLSIRSTPTGGKRSRRFRDIDRVRFRAAEGENHAPIANLDPVDVILPGLPTIFDASGSQDPDGDWLTYAWTFSDGQRDSRARPVLHFDDVADDLTATVTVSDGQATASATDTVLVRPALDPGRTAGVLRLEGTKTLEFGAVPLGGAGALTFTVHNLDQTPTSQLKVRMGSDSADLQLNPTALDLGPGATADVTVTFAPTLAGHQGPNLTLVASASNRPVAHLLAHGFGGSAPNTGPTYATETLFSNLFGGGTFAVLPSGQRVQIDNRVNICQKPDGSGTHDLCAINTDCVNAGESCGASPLSGLLEPNDLCVDGQGDLYLLSDENAFTSPGGNTDLTIDIMHIKLDANGNRLSAEMFAHTNNDTMQIACDKRPDGRLFVARYEDLSGSCPRDAQEVLEGIRRSTGVASDLYSPIDAAELQDVCNGDFDEVGDLEVTRDGASAFASFQRNGGIYRILGPPPTPQEIVQPSCPPPSSGSGCVDDTFQVHPDGSILYAKVSDRRSSSLISLYKVFPEQAVAAGPPILEQLPAPCATFTVLNNGGKVVLGQVSIAAGRAAPGSNDAVVLLSFSSNEGTVPHPGDTTVLAGKLRPQGTVAFASPAGDVPCTALQIITLDQFDPMTF